jgi:hypothetical protein
VNKNRYEILSNTEVNNEHSTDLGAQVVEKLTPDVEEQVLTHQSQPPSQPPSPREGEVYYDHFEEESYLDSDPNPHPKKFGCITNM